VNRCPDDGAATTDTGRRGRGDRHRSRRSPRVLKKLALAALAAGAVVVVRKRSAGKGEADLWAEATSGPGAVSTPRS
jgi:hypothetical protein